MTGEGRRVEMYYFSAADITSDDVVFEAETDEANSPSKRRSLIYEMYNMGLFAGEDGKVSEETRERVLELLRPLDEEENFTQFYFPQPGQLKVFLKGGSSLVVDVATGQAVYESVKPRPVIAPMVRLHFNPGGWWTWFADAFSVCLILITLTGLWMVKGPKGLWGRGGIELLVGILIPLCFLLF